MNQLDKLMQEAIEASKKAYAPYSNFPVGAALITADGTIFSGCNVENKSFGLTNCAERTAIFKAISEGAKGIDTLVIYTPTQKPIAPCGACRQVISEFSSSARIVSICATDKKIDSTINDLHPNPEFPVDLRKEK